jgi:uncharacterized membrane protein
MKIYRALCGISLLKKSFSERELMPMSKERLEAFSDGVIAIIITIMVLEFKVPHEGNLEALKPLIPIFLSYVLSFIYIGIYWNNHHHLFQLIYRINGRVMWANLHLLFWLSLVPFATVWMGESHFSTYPVVVYGTLLLFSGFAYWILTKSLISSHGKDSTIAIAIGKDFKGILSLAIYALAILLAFVNTLLACGLYILVAIIWFIPDRRIEKNLPRE